MIEHSTVYWTGEDPVGRLHYAWEIWSLVTGIPTERASEEIPAGERVIHCGSSRKTREGEWLELISEGLEGIERYVIPTGTVAAPFSVSTEGILPYDPLSALFWTVTRCEELNAETNEQGRVPSEKLWFVQHGLESTPWVHRWAKDLAKSLGRIAVERSSEVVFSVDIDQLYALKGRPLGHSVLASMQEVLRGKWGRLCQRWKVLTGKAKDPFDVLEEHISAWKGKPWRYFALLTLARTPKDRGVSPYQRGNRARWKELDGLTHALGGLAWHPSTRAGVCLESLQEEKQLFEGIIGRAVDTSRFHFLQMKLPESYRWLETLGIRHDHSMGFADRSGWRAGIALPYPWFDVKQNRRTGLMVHPFFTMDGVYLYYNPVSNPFEEWRKERILCSKEGVDFSFLTHWRLFSEAEPEWKGWNQWVHECLENHG